MTRDNVIAALHRISANFNEKSVCRFPGTAIKEKPLGFIDTSQGQNGSLGIVFFENTAVVNFNGAPREIPFRKIRETQIISSFEDVFSDELLVICEDGDVRISDFSLNKSELKNLLDELCADCVKNLEHKIQAEQLASIIADNSAENAPRGFAPTIISEPIPEPVNAEPEENIPEENLNDIVFEDGAPFISETVVSETAIPKTDIPKSPIAEPAEPESAPSPKPSAEPKINWISGDLRTAVIDRPREKTTLSFEVVDSVAETSERAKIENMTREETLSFLAESLDEINAPVPAEPGEQTEERLTISDYTPPEPPEEPKVSTLTVEPFWGDIYIKASRNLRELCESGKLSMKQIEAELNDRLLDSARAFAEITSDKAKVPKVLIPKITELKAAAYNFDQYFLLGEDIAVRAMFFMQYQMLSYADRIAETPDTKERLNNFFRRFGPAGITLSMLDMRV